MERFRALKEEGMNAVLISCSPFQQERIPLRRVLNAIEAGLSVFGRGGVMVYQGQCIRWVAEISTDEPVPIEAYIERYGSEGAGRLFWEEYGLIPGGRSGFTLGHLTRRHPPEAFMGLDCRRELLYPNHSHFDLYGNHISWFCGGLSVGRWSELEKTIREFERGIYPSPVDILVSEGPYGLYRLAAEKYGFKPSPEGYVGKCHLCTDVRRHLVKTGDFPALRPKKFYESLFPKGSG
ncbi:MAG TPA: radical SAM protein [Armatimonadetes bacterium]|nr:radical SAM protein [Armatimonadota bacterium]